MAPTIMSCKRFVQYHRVVEDVDSALRLRFTYNAKQAIRRHSD